MATSIAKPATGKSAVSKPKREIVKIHVKFMLNTPDGLRRVVFELEKENEDKLAKWKIIFQLFERAKKSDPFGDAIVDLLVEVDIKREKKAQKMADEGMTPSQAAYAMGPGADKSKLPDKTKAKAAVEKTLDK
jgi:hypothetical protein